MELAEMMDPVESDRFVIDSDAKADWALRKIREQREDAERWRAYYLAQIAKAEESAQQTEAFFMALLERYFATVPHRSTKTQDAYDLPSGKLLRKAQQPDYQRDDTQLLAWAKANAPELVEVKETVRWGDLKKRLASTNGQAADKETGEIVPGVTVTYRDPVFTVSLAKEAGA